MKPKYVGDETWHTHTMPWYYGIPQLTVDIEVLHDVSTDREVDESLN